MIGRRIITTTILFLLCLTGLTADAAAGYSNGRLWIVKEPDVQSPYVNYYVNGKQKPKQEMDWRDNGRSGKAVSVAGSGQYLEIGYQQVRIHRMTLAGWINWRGAAEGEDEQSAYLQRLFTLSRNDYTYLTLMPHAKNADKNIDGVYMEFSMGDKQERVNYEYPNLGDNKESFRLSLNQWHHVAVTMDGQYLRLYIDGNMVYEQLLILGTEEMQSNKLTIGGGRWDKTTLNALIDDYAIYEFAMTSEQIAMLNSGIDPLAEGASLPAKTSATQTRPTTTTVHGNEKGDGTLFGIPLPAVWIAGALVILFLVLSVVLSIYRPKLPDQRDER